MMRWLSVDSSGREAVIMLVAALLVVFLPELLPLIYGYSELATTIIIFALFALGFDILLGLTGYLSFGHAAFWGVGAYVSGYYLLHVSNNALVSMLVGVLVVTVIAVILGLITLRRHGIYFAILTLAFAQMFYYAVLSPLQHWTGGDDGLSGIPTPYLLGGIPLSHSTMHYFAAFWVILGVYLARRIRRSPYGLMLRAIHSNETRLRHSGINVFRYKLMAFVVSGIYAGLAGTLYAIYQTYVPSHSLYWTTSGEVVMMAVIGGIGTLFGPMIGAGVVLYLENVLSGVTAQWHLILGLIFMAFVIFLPGGIIDGVRRLARAVSRDRRSATAEVAREAPAERSSTVQQPIEHGK